MAEFDRVFDQLRTLMLEAAPGMESAKDAPGDLVLKTRWTEARTGQPAWFGSVTIKRSYVAYHLVPLYDDAELQAAIPPVLEKRRQGKTCFNFRQPDAALFEELAALTRRVRAAVG